ncbi:MAG: SOS response-associated peptidase [Alphaproteobacteria bacterium]|nr:SOS response-associated peptidase [Alphaproteobacteria bacterium]
MCGRYVYTLPPDAMAQLFRLERTPDYAPHWNIAPTQMIPIVRTGADGAREGVMTRWGLHPGWMKEPPGAKSMINARSEGAAEKPFFRDAYRRRRAIVPADGFYEWRREGAVKTPYFIRRVDGLPIAFAGLWERWRGAEGGAVETAAILTTAANGDVAHLHDRMPVMLAPEDVDLWLDPAAPRAALDLLLRAPPEALLEAYPVSRAVNSPANDAPGLIAPAA